MKLHEYHTLRTQQPARLEEISVLSHALNVMRPNAEEWRLRAIERVVKRLTEEYDRNQKALEAIDTTQELAPRK